MRRSEQFNSRIIRLYESDIRADGPKKLAHREGIRPVVQIREGDVRYSHQLSLKIDGQPRITLKLINGLTYQEEMAQKTFLRQMKKAELIYKNMEQTADAAQLVRELDVQRRQQNKLNEIKKEIIQESRDEVHYIVRRQMREQTGALTEKVYRRLEQKLQDEKRRRGL
ncbi:hypothetical protein [Dorea sp. D27]|uniref:hypothetical protein n=1 Tax=Dorea sp. D27 TaxID=658665 RepID=UPI0006735FA2|nr:hypothetical protein [Dorea sp. D27]KMZ53591.1 hypothetical protein HMPREF0980_02460 [Dorea sp. D27]